MLSYQPREAGRSDLRSESSSSQSGYVLSPGPPAAWQQIQSWNVSFDPGLVCRPYSTAPSPGFLTPVPWAAHAGHSDFSSQLQVSPASASCAEEEWHCWSGTSPRAEAVQLLSCPCVLGGREGADVPDSWLNQGPTINVLCSETGVWGAWATAFCLNPRPVNFQNS